jgi:two-component system, chemotaxis family, chemotaxis protein CheY
MGFESSISVLVIDDFTTMVRIVRNILRHLDFVDIDEASNGAEALAKMRRKHYGLVISDWNMQPMTGLELLREVRADSNLCKTPFILVTSESHRDKVIAAKQAGVTGYIVKPFSPQTLKAKIDAALAETVQPAF